MESLLQDIRFAWRSLLKKPGFALVVIFTLTLGIGANAAIFSIVNALLIRPLPYPDAERLVYIGGDSDRNPLSLSSVSPPNFSDLRERSRSLDGYFAFRYTSFALNGDGVPESLSGLMVTGDFGQTMGVRPVLGRLFTNAEDAPGKNQVVLISHGLWQRRFGGASDIVGKTVKINGEPHIILGVMPSDFAFPSLRNDIWKPMGIDPATTKRGSSYLQTIGRLKKGVSVQKANQEANRIADEIVRENASSLRELKFNLLPFRKGLVGDIEKPLYVLTGVVLLVLLIACFNVANLTLSRATVRWKEITVRAALGASRARLIRMVLVESVLLSLVGGSLGLLVAKYGTKLLLNIYPGVIPNSSTVDLDPVVVLFTLTVSVLTGLAFGIVPAWQVSRTNLNQVLREQSRTSTGSGSLKLFRHGLVISEIGLSLVLLIGAGLLLRSFWNLLQIDPGFRSENVVAANVSLPQSRYKDPAQQDAFYLRTLEKLRATPGVQNVSAVSNLPFTNSRGASSFSIDDQPTPPDASQPVADYHETYPDYFQAMGIKLRAGRDFSPNDDRTHPGVAIVNERFVKRFFPNENPLGKRITIGSPEEDALYGKGVSREIVGVIANVKLLDLDADFQPELYVPAAQIPNANLSIVVRGTVPTPELIGALERAVTATDSLQPIRRPQTLETAVSASVAPRRFTAFLLLLFAGIAVVLALVGVYGVMSYIVSQRTSEIGIRMALGATLRDVLKLIIGQGAMLIFTGTAIGLIGAYLLTRLMQGMLFGISPTDPLTFFGIAGLLVCVGLLACLIPARRATRTDPMIALRNE